MWCGTVSWSWSYTYFDTIYEDPEFRIEETCWLVGRTQQALTMEETLQIGDSEIPDGWCRYHAPEEERDLTEDSECAFLMRAQDQSGYIFTLEQFWRLDSGAMSLSDTNLSIEANFKTATYFEGNELWGDATVSYSGQKTAGIEPIEPSGGLLEARNDCALDGCWRGSFTGNVVTGPSSCASVLDEYSFSNARIEAKNGGRDLTVDGQVVATFPYLQTCELVAVDSTDTGGNWTYRMNESTPGSVLIEIELEVLAPNATNGEICELYWQADGATCPA
jgi:hypothetical protein